MSVRKSTEFFQSLRGEQGAFESVSLELIREEPLSILVEDRPCSVVMRTPGEEVFQAAGFCLGEGLVDSADELEKIGYDEHLDANRVDVWLAPARREKVGHLLERKAFVSQTSCGICGKELIGDLLAELTPLQDEFEIESDRLFACLDRLGKQQQYFKQTRCSHAALILDSAEETISFAEDVGRHNALDKAVGRALMEGKLSGGRILVLSSRNSYELVQKAARARLPVMLSNSRPTALAVEMGRALGLTLAFPAGPELVVLCGERRIKGARKP